MHKILMTYKNTEGLEKLLSHSELKVEIHAKPSPEKFIELIRDYDGLLIRSEVKVTKDVIEQAKNLKVVLRAGTGVDNVDIPTATQKGIVVMNVPGGNTISACEHTIALLLALSRNIPQAQSSMKSKLWEKEKFTGTEVQGKTLGLIGLGRIGREVAKRALAFEMKVVAHDPYVTDDYAKSIGVILVSLDELYAQADYISLHTLLNEQTKHLIGSQAISRMKKGVRIINCARGGIIDEKALYEGLKSGYVKAAALDVFEKEPLPGDSPLLELGNVILTPHLGASTEEAQIKIATECSDMLIDFFTKGIVRNAVNIPQIDIDSYHKLKPYLDLTERMGGLQSQIIDGRIKEIEITYSGDVSSLNTMIITLAFLKGLLTPILDIRVNFVNAMHLAKERGIKVKETKATDSENYTSLISSTINSDIPSVRPSTIDGTLFAHRYPRIVNINDLDVDVVPAGCMIVLENMDKPGVIGKVGTILGGAGINIASMQVGRKTVGGEAITIINIDNRPAEDTLNKISKIDGVTKVKFVQL